MLDGLVVVDKPSGITSHGVVARVRRLAGTRKVGHAGTLDPMATGVLVLGVNRATRLLGHLTLTDKSYRATIRLGVTTTTDDAEGETIARHGTQGVTPEAVREGLAAMVGTIDQRPSAVSAIKVDGVRAYARVRAGEAVDLPARQVRIDRIEVAAIRGDDIDIEVDCSSGTYIRAIARDLGERLGVGGHLTALRRTRVGAFGEAEAHSLEALDEHFALIPIAQAARASFAAFDADPEQADDVRVGRSLAADLGSGDPVAVFAPDGQFLALYHQRGDHARPVAVFV